MRTDLTGKMDALAPTFRLLTASTGREQPADYLWVYVEHFTQQGLMPEAVNETVRGIVVSWSASYWPSPEYIAVRARQKQREVMGELHGVPSIQRMIDDACELVDQEKWDRRLQMATEYRTKRPDRFKQLMEGIDANIRHMLATGHVWMKESQVYRQSFRDGSAVGACIAAAGIEERREQRQREQERADRARQAAA